MCPIAPAQTSICDAGRSLCGRTPVGIGHHNTIDPSLLRQFSIAFPRNGTDQREIKTTDLGVGKRDGWSQWSKIWGNKMSREKAEMRVRNGNENTHTPRAYTHAAILLIHSCHLCLTPFLPLPVGERPTFLQQPPLLSPVSPYLPRLTRQCCCPALWVIARNKMLHNGERLSIIIQSRNVKAQNWLQDPVCRMCFISYKSDVKTRRGDIPNQQDHNQRL